MEKSSVIKGEDRYCALWKLLDVEMTPFGLMNWRCGMSPFR